MVSAHDRLSERIGGLFDYGFDRRLVTCYPVLRDKKLERWRDPKLVERLARWLSNDVATEELSLSRRAAARLPRASAIRARRSR